MPTVLKNWVNVTPGSKLRVQVDGEVPARGEWRRIRQSDDAEVASGTLTDPQLRDGFEKEVRDGETLAVDVTLTFIEEETRSGTLAARITKPDGSVHGKPLKREVSGKRGDPEDNTFMTARAK